MIPGINTGGGGLSNSSSAASGPARAGGNRFGGGGSFVKGVDPKWLIGGAVVVAVLWLYKK